MHRLSSLCAHGHNNGSEVCVSRDVLVRLPRLVRVVDVRITDSFVLSVHVFQIVLAISCLKKAPILAQYQSIFYTY